MRVYDIADSITTNQKVAGSSPADRAKKFLQNAVKRKPPAKLAGAFGSSTAAVGSDSCMGGRF